MVNLKLDRHLWRHKYLKKVLTVPPFVTFNSVSLTFPSLSAWVLLMRAIGHWFLFTWGFLSSTKSPSLTSVWVSCHLVQLCRIERYSRLHLSQNAFAKRWTCYHCWRHKSVASKDPGGGRGVQTFSVRIIAGVRRTGESGSVDIGARGLEFIMAATSAIRVQSTSWARC